jgi:thiaminase/transcriptional activator TenA
MAHDASPSELDAMRQAFLTSSRYEYMFWEAAYRREQWPL